MAGFEQFWAAYPRREARKDAMKAWVQSDGESNLDAILAALEWQRRSDSWKRGFVPLAATYLRGERWTDENPQAAVGADPLYVQFQRWQQAKGEEGANVTFEQFKAYAIARRERA